MSRTLDAGMKRSPSARPAPRGGGRIVRGALAALAALGGALPIPVLRAVARSAAALAYRSLPRLRSDMDANARRLLRHDAPAAARAALARAQLASFADFAVEMAAAGRRHGSADDLLAGVEGPEHLARALEPGKGVVAVTLHIGNYELAAASLAPRVPGGVAIVYDRDPSRRWERRRSRWRDTAGIGSIALGGSPFFAVDALALLKRGGAALVAADQVERRTGETFLFLGAPAVFSLFPARLAASAGAPILPAFAVRAPGGRRLLHLDPPIFPGTRDARDVTAELLIVLERFLSDHAGEWLMLRRFWSE